MSLNKQITIAEVLNAISKHRMKAAATFILVMALVTAMFVIWPRMYGSEGRLFVQLGRNGTGLDPTAGNASISIQDSRETEIRSVVELVKSRAILESVVEKIGPDEILESLKSKYIRFELPSLSLSSGSTGVQEISKAEFARLKTFEKAVRAVEDLLTVSAEKKTSVISIYCKAGTPQLAQRIVQEIMRQTQATHLDVHAIKGSTEFFDENFRKKQDELVRLEKLTRDFRNENQFLSIDGAVATQQLVVDKLALELLDANVNYSQAQARLKNIQQQMNDIEPTIMVPRSGVEKLSTEDSRTELFKLESNLKRLENQLQPDHPRLISLRQSVAALRADLQAMPDDRTESLQQINPVYEKVKVALVEATAAATSLKSRLDNLEALHAQALTEMATLNQKRMPAQQLSRDTQIARQEMDLYIRKRAESAVIDELDQKRISDVVVAQPANFVVKHVSPEGGVIMPLGLLLALICSVMTALYFERDLLSGHLSEEEVEQILAVPILVSLPRVASHRNMVS